MKIVVHDIELERFKELPVLPHVAPALGIQIVSSIFVLPNRAHVYDAEGKLVKIFKIREDEE